MRLRYIITLLLTGSILSGVALIFLILNVAPTDSILIPGLLTVLFFFFILGILSSGLITLRSRGERAWRAQVNLAISVRQGIVIGLLASFCLWLARVNILSLWLVVLLITITAFVEYQLLPPALREQHKHE